MSLDYSKNRFRLSFAIPVTVVLFTSLFKEGFWMALLITFLEITCFWALNVAFVEGFLAVNRTERPVKWKQTAFGVNLACSALYLSGILIPLARITRDMHFPRDAGLNALRAAAANPGYQALVLMPNITSIVAAGLFIGMLALAIHRTHGVESLKALVFAVPVSILAFTLSTVIAGAPFNVAY